MPSTTFFRLPPAKREKLLRAARSEFAHVPFAQVSINRIIQAAEIPRGSFYMYFADKEELFLYLMGAYGRALEEHIGTRLENARGNPFDALLQLYDDTGAWSRSTSQNETVYELLCIMRLNPHMHTDLLVHADASECMVSRLVRYVDPMCLDIQGESDLEEMLDLLLKVTGGAIVSATLSGAGDAVRERLVNQFAILKRGMSAKATQT